MILTTYDKMFLQQLQSFSLTNRGEGDKVAMVTNLNLLSDDLLELFGIKGRQSQGAWFFNVYVEFEPMFKTKAAEDWQK